jgi:transcription termination factor NusB
MFAKDYHLLNEIYSKKINEMNIGPKGDNDSVTPSPSNISKIQLPPKKNFNSGEQEEHNTATAKECKANLNPGEDCEGYNPSTYDSNGQMSRQLLFRIFKLSAMLHDILNNKENVEAWVLSKITNAHDQLESVFGYEDYEMAKNPAHATCGNLDENNEEELFSAISKGGEQLINQLNKILKKESIENLEKVLLETILILENKKKLV